MRAETLAHILNNTHISTNVCLYKVSGEGWLNNMHCNLSDFFSVGALRTILTELMDSCICYMMYDFSNPLSLFRKLNQDHLFNP